MSLPDFHAAFAHLDRFVERRMRADRVPGAAVALTDRERTLRVATYGFANLAAGTPVAPETLFEIGSIGKSFTAIALLQLRDEGRVDLDAPVTTYLPWFQVRSKHGPIALHHLLSHTAGIISGTDATPDALSEVWALRDTEASASPGTRFHYSNVGYKALGLVLEAIEGRPYGEIIRGRILEPLGMAATAPTITSDIRPRLATGYVPLHDDRPDQRRHPLVPAPWLETGTGDGSLAATPGDMAAYLRLFLNRGLGPRGRVLSEAGFARLIAPVVPVPEWVAGTRYAYGVANREVDGHTQVGHPGSMVGFTSGFVADLDDGLAVVVLMNGTGAPNQIARFALRTLGAALRGEPLPEPPPVADPDDGPAPVEGADEYAGVHTARTGGGTFAIEVEKGWLALRVGDARVPLEERDEDAFWVDHPNYALDLLTFGRDDSGRVVEAFHGEEWFTNDRYAGPTEFAYPPAWNAYPGHYRSHNPWLSNLRVFLRKGQLILSIPNGALDFGDGPLVPLPDGSFRVGSDKGSPERARFDTVVDGRALRVNLSGCDLYRFFTP